MRECEHPYHMKFSHYDERGEFVWLCPTCSKNTAFIAQQDFSRRIDYEVEQNSELVKRLCGEPEHQNGTSSGCTTGTSTSKPSRDYAVPHDGRVEADNHASVVA